MLVGEPGPGIMVGMGVGFVAGSLVRIEHRRISISLPSPALGVSLAGVGAVLIAMGILMLYGIEIPWRLLGGLLCCCLELLC